MEFVYSLYNHESFNNLKFEVLDEWIIEEIGLETVFTNVDLSLPQLHFQTLGKSEQFDDARTFYKFILNEDNPGNVVSFYETECNGFPSLLYEYQEKEFPKIYVYALIIDVMEGILWFYLKVPFINREQYKPITTNILNTLEFK